MKGLVDVVTRERHEIVNYNCGTPALTPVVSESQPERTGVTHVRWLSRILSFKLEFMLYCTFPLYYVRFMYAILNCAILPGSSTATLLRCRLYTPAVTMFASSFGVYSQYFPSLNLNASVHLYCITWPNQTPRQPWTFVSPSSRPCASFSLLSFLPSHLPGPSFASSHS